MNRIVRAACFAVAALALVDPAGAAEVAAPAALMAAPPGAVPAASTMSDPNAFAKMWSTVTALVTPGDAAQAVSAAPPAVAPLAELVLAHAATETADREQECLAKAVYFEARSEPLEGQLAVAEVVMNRAASGRYPTDLCAVITQKAQFSFIQRGKFPRPDRDSAAWKKAVAVAVIARQKLADTLPSTVLWYHATYVSPTWGKRLTKQTQIGLHIFYS